ncbi:hypothetical protein V6Z12_A09G036400 [Gossypium hirsutum]
MTPFLEYERKSSEEDLRSTLEPVELPSSSIHAPPRTPPRTVVGGLKTLVLPQIIPFLLNVTSFFFKNDSYIRSSREKKTKNKI